MSSFNPFGLISDLMGMRESAERIRTYQQLNRQRQEELNDDDAIRGVLQRHTPVKPAPVPPTPTNLGQVMGPEMLVPNPAGGPQNPYLSQVMGKPEPAPKLNTQPVADDDPEPDFGAAIYDLYASGRGSAALKLQNSLIAVRKEQLANLKARNEDNLQRLESASRIAQGVTDQESYNRALPMLRTLVGENIMAEYGTQYDPEKIEQMVAQGRTASDHLRGIKDAFDMSDKVLSNTRDAINDQREWGTRRTEIEKNWTDIGSQLLSLANNQQDWDSGIEVIRQGTSMLPGNIASNIINRFGTEFSDSAKERARLLGMTQDQRSDERQENTRIADARAARDETDDEPLTEQALENLAYNFAMSGQLPAMGMGRQAANNRTRIFNRAGEIFGGLNLAQQGAAYKANASSLTAIQRNIDAVASFERTALGNAKQFLDAAQKVIDSGSPYVNRPLRELSADLLGSEAMAEFRTAREIIVPEFARLLTQPNLTGQLTDTARGEISSIVDENATLGQLVSSINVLMQDAARRKTELQAQYDAITDRMNQAPAAMRQSLGIGGQQPGTPNVTGAGTQQNPYVGDIPPTAPRMGAYWMSPNGLTRWNGQMWAVMQGAQ